MIEETQSVEGLLPYAKHVVSGPWVGQTTSPGYDIKAGEKVLLAVNNFYEELVVKTMVAAIREAGASVDVLIVDSGPDRELDELDEIRSRIRTKHWTEAEDVIRGVGFGSGYGRLTWVEDLGHRYDALIFGASGPGASNVPYRSAVIPWFTAETLGSPATLFPYELQDAINRKAWEPIWSKGRGGRVRLIDPEGTDVSFTLWEEYYEAGGPYFTQVPFWAHLMGHPLPPLLPKEDATGVVAGTTNHASCPFPHIKVHVEEGRVARVEGGGKYGDAWRDLLERVKDLQYPDYPDKGLFWFFEIAIGTLPKRRRPKNAFTVFRGGTLYERLRSGIIHTGFGTIQRSPSEEWAGRQGQPYGHLHVHLLFPTYEITTKAGEKIKVIDKGHLTALDDPEVVAIARKYGDPNELLKEDWVAPIPGISVPGDYWRDYAKDPFSWVKVHG